MRSALWVLPLVGLAIAVPHEAEAQFFLGGHAAYTTYQDGGWGGGARAGLDIPVLPLDIMGAVELFSPSCPEGRDGCSLWGASLDANLRLPIPLVRPYITGGLSYRDGDRGGELGSASESGLNLGLGVDVNLGIRIFADWRYEFLGEFEEGLLRAGLNFNL
jgi:opacity protein-like surface antigen